MADSSTPILVELGRIRDHSRALRELLGPTGDPLPDSVLLAPHLLTMLLAANSLMAMVAPPPAPEAFRGWPTEPAMRLMVQHRDHPDWDFGPWFGEKVTALRRSVDRLIRLCWPMSDSYLLVSDNSGTQRLNTLTGIDTYSSTIYDFIFQNQLTVQDEPHSEDG